MIDHSHPVTRLANLRDLGGASSGEKTVLHGLLFRSDDVAIIDSHQEAELADLGLELIVDLRSKKELESVGRGPLAAHSTKHLHLPLLDYIGEDHNLGQEDLAKEFTNQMLGAWYANVLVQAAPMIVEGVAAIAQAEGPALFHCAIGKDRTGIFAASIYSLLGVGRDHIVEDFAKTDANLPQILARLTHSQPFWTEDLMLKTGALMRAEAQAMEAMLDTLIEAGTSISEVLNAAGADDAMIQDLQRKHLG